MKRIFSIGLLFVILLCMTACGNKKLLHHPGTDDVKAYKAMEKAVGEGKICFYAINKSKT